MVYRIAVPAESTTPTVLPDLSEVPGADRLHAVYSRPSAGFGVLEPPSALILKKVGVHVEINLCQFY